MNLSKAGRQIQGENRKKQSYQGKIKKMPMWSPLQPVFPLARPRPVLAGILGTVDEPGSQERHLMNKLKTRDSQN